MGEARSRVAGSLWMRLLLFACWVSTCLSKDRTTEHRASPAFQEYDSKIDKGKYGSYPVQKFQSSPMQAPRTNFLLQSPECTSDPDEFLFLTPKGWKVQSPGPMILDSHGQLIWTQHFDNEFGGQAYDLMVQEYQGEKHLTFWLGDDRIKGHGAGHFYMLNSSYDIVHKVGATNGKFADLHEFLITPEGTALIIIFEVIPFDIRPAGRKFNDVWNQRLWDCLIQEVDIATGEAVFEWRASDHLDMRDSYKKLVNMNDGTASHPFDPWHFNSVEKDDLNNYLVSARYTHAVYYISGRTKEVIWTLGGKSNYFMDLSAGHALNFAWQHDARFHALTAFPESYTPLEEKIGVNTTLLTLFDNAAEDWNYEYGHPHARGMVLEITYPSSGSKPSRDQLASVSHVSDLADDLSALDKSKLQGINGADPLWTVRSIRPYFNAAQVRSSSQGSLQVLPPRKAGEDSRVVIGHGLNAVVSEYSGSRLLCDMHFGAQSSWEKGDVQSYRGLKFSGWVGRPKQSPAVVLKGSSLFVSWNGATDVKSWTLEVSDSGDEGSWADAGSASKAGFETELLVPQESRNARFLRVIAIDHEGKTCENGMKVLDRGSFASSLFGGLSRWQSILLLSISFAGVYYAALLLRQRSRVARRMKADRWKLP